jgi:hypothetical protein
VAEKGDDVSRFSLMLPGTLACSPKQVQGGGIAPEVLDVREVDAEGKWTR